MAMGGNTKTLQQFAIAVGIDLNDSDAIQRANLLAQELQKVFKSKLANGQELFNFDKDFKNVRQLTNLINKIGAGNKKAIFSDADSTVLAKYILSFKDLHNVITTATVDLNEFNRVRNAENTGEIIETERPLVSTTVSDKTAITQSKENLNLYNRTLGVLDSIHNIKLKLVTADKQTSLLLREQLSTLQQELNANVNSGKLTSKQTRNINDKSSYDSNIEGQYESIVNHERAIAKEQKTQNDLQKDYEQSLNREVSLQEKINTAKANDNNATASYLQKQLTDQQEYSNNIKTQITNKEKLLSLENEYASKVALVNVKEQDRQAKQDEKIDITNIDKAIKAYQNLTEAKIKMVKLQNNNANDVVLKQQSTIIKELENSYKNLTSVVLKDNTTVAENAKVVSNVVSEDRKLVEAQNQVTTGLRNSSVSVTSFNSKFSEMIANVFQYKVAANIFQQVDQAIVASVQKVKSLDDAMTQVRLVTGQSSQSAQQLMGQYADLAIQLNTTTEEVAKGSVEWLFNRGHYKSLELTGKSLEFSILTYNGNIYKGKQ